MEATSDNIQSKPTAHISNEEIQEFNGIDIAFVIDTTSSMGPYITEAKSSIIDIIQTSEEPIKEAFPIDYKDRIKFGIVAYRDHPPQDSSYVTSVMDFSDSIETLKNINLLSPSGGGDTPEAAMDGMNDALNKLSWRKDSDKMLFLILDAPPHGIRFGTTYDCPCQITEESFLPAMAEKKIKFFIIKKPNDNQLEKMVQIFKKYIDLDVKDFSGTGSLFGDYMSSVGRPTSTMPMPVPSGGLFRNVESKSTAPTSMPYYNSIPTSYSNTYLNSSTSSSLFGAGPGISNHCYSLETSTVPTIPNSFGSLGPSNISMTNTKSEMNQYIVSNCMSNINYQIKQQKK